MAELTQTPANVVSGSGVKKKWLKRAIAGAAITAGMPIYVDADGLLQPSRGNSAIASACNGIALNGAASGQYCNYQTEGNINLGATLVIGVPYYVSDATAGKIRPDLGAGDYSTFLGIADATNNLYLKPQASGVALGTVTSGDLSITVANVLPGSGATIASGFAGGTITRGDTVRVGPDDTLVRRASNNGFATPLEDEVAGIALNDASSGQPVDYQTDGQITIGGTMIVGETYFIDADPGHLIPLQDVVELDSLVSKVGMAISASILELDIYNSGAAVH